MRKLLSLALLALSFVSPAKDTLNLESKLLGATVFFTGAELNHSSKISLKKGIQLVKISGLPIHLNPQTVQVKGQKGILIRSVSTDQEKFAFKKSQAEKDVLEKIKEIDIERARISEEYHVLTGEEELLLANQDLGSSKGAKVEEVKLAAAYYRARFNEIKNRKIDIKIALKRMEERKREILINQISLNKSKEIKAFILIELESEFTGETNLEFSYFIESAGWNPTYDFRVEELNKPIEINYKAEIFQSSGFDWKDIEITLSSSSPSQSGKKPSLVKWYITQPDPLENKDQLRHFGGVKGVVIDRSGEPLPFANLHFTQNEKVVYAGQADAEGRFKFNPLPVGNYKLSAYYLGFKKFTVGLYVRLDEFTSVDVVMDEAANQVKEVAVVETISSQAAPSRSMSIRNEAMSQSYNIRGSRGGNSDVYIDGIKVRGSGSLPQLSADQVNLKTPPSYISTSLKTAVLNYEYKINTPYTIPSNGEIYTVQFKQELKPVTYEFQLVPRLSKDGYLVALLSDWDELNLVSGEVQIFYQGTFQGKSFLDTDVLTDTMEISLGRDKGIVVSRISDKENLKWFNLGKTSKEQVAWTIEVFNSKPQEVRVVVKDQFPFSDHSQIKIELQEAPGAKVIQNKGILIWSEKLQPGEKVKYKYTYTLEYPVQYQHLFR